MQTDCFGNILGVAQFIDEAHWTENRFSLHIVYM